jgi:signal transduction histidine kinase/CheY-like chemotaxis protein
MLGAMRVRTTILLLLLLAGTAFVAGLLQVRRVETAKFESATGDLQKLWEGEAARFWEEQTNRVYFAAQKLPDREGAVDAILGKDSQWAEKHLGADKLSSFGINALWIYHSDGTLFYSVANTDRDDLKESVLPPDSVAKLFNPGPPRPFVQSLKSTVPGGVRLLQICGARIYLVWDKNHQEAAQGYCLAGRIWDDEELRQALLGGTGRGHFLWAKQGAPPRLSGEMMQVPLPPLRDWQGRNVAWLALNRENPQIAVLQSRSDRVFWWLLIGALVLFVVLYLLLNRAVVRPLQRVIQSLHTKDMRQLDPLRGNKAEFGELAGLIREFFEQQARLMREMFERSAAEKALQESEEMLRHSQKMEAVGRLAGGVAHDFNNLLTAIIGYAQLLRQRFTGNAAVRQPAELIHQAGEQAAGLTRQLLAFSRKQLLQPKIIDLNEIITRLQRLLQRIIGEHIEIVARPEAEEPRVKADPGQIDQVIVNLGVNARDAMPGGGKLTIRTHNTAVTDANPVPELAPGEYVVLEVTDTGEGMDADTKARIFEPFFTTKGPGKGTGLGLATVYGIVKQSRGAIVVESERGRGSTFRVYLPRELSPVQTTVAAPSAAAAGVGQESILIVEDEEIVRDLVSEVLRGQGYRVFARSGGHEALHFLRDEKLEIDLLISDVVMPEMNGARVAQSVHELCPKARVLFVSGYSESDMADQGLEALAYQVLQKPFTPDTLTAKVRAVLDGAKG